MKLLSLIPLVTLATSVYAAPQSFDFKDPKGVNNAVFSLDAPLESVNGSASGISGTVSFDSENPSATTGKIVVAAESMTVPNPMQKEHLHVPEQPHPHGGPEEGGPRCGGLKTITMAGREVIEDVSGQAK